MPSSLLFGISHEGRVYGLSTSGSKWRELVYLGLEFKALSAVPHMLWAIGGDRQVYVYMYGLDIPIRIKEEAFENERWLPLEGFSKRLFPMDRFQFSSADGLTDRTLSKIRLPSMAWQWESDWHLELTLDGQPLDHDGWTYAVDFPASYHPQKQWSSCVRRRKWVRYRRYSALNSWCAIAPLHKDPTKEPFIDVAVGGQHLTGSDEDCVLVWAVTAHGRVMFRSGVSSTSPEGSKWIVVAVPSGSEIKQICVSATGLVWAVLWNGKALVRAGVTHHNPMGEYWLEVGSPNESQRLNQVAIGTNAGWAVTNSHHVWFRRGIRGAVAGESEECARGTGWVEMVGKMALISVASNDQVWAIGAEDRLLYFRTGVSLSELTGKTWRLMAAPSQLSRASSSASLWSGISMPNARQNSSLVNGPSSACDIRCDSSDNDSSASYPNSTLPNLIQSKFQETFKSVPPRSLPKLDLENESSLPCTGQSPRHTKFSHSLPHCTKEGVRQSTEQLDELREPDVKTNPTVWSPVQSVGGLLGTEALPDSDFNAFISVDALDGSESDGLWDVGTSNLLWSCVAAGAALVDPASLPNWFVENCQDSVEPEFYQPWRMKLLHELKTRTACATAGFEGYEKAIDKASWVKSGRAKAFLKDHVGHSEDCALELEWIGNESGTLSILSWDRVSTKLQLSISEITCVASCSEPGIPCIAVHTSRLRPSKGPLKLQFSSETEMEDWMAHLTLVCCQVNGTRGRPSAGSLWATTTRGDVFVFDPAILETHQLRGETYVQEMLVAGRSTPYESHLHNSFPPGSRITLVASPHHDTERFAINLVCRCQSSSLINSNDIALHFNPRFPDSVVVRNTKRNGVWEQEERGGSLPVTLGEAFTLSIICLEDAFQILVDECHFVYFEHRMKPHLISHIEIDGTLSLHKLIYESKMVIVSPADMFWRQMGGHLRKVETCAAGVTWGIGYDHTPWVYTGGWGGSFLKGLETSSSGINPMSDTNAYYVYENQRWNPLTGYTAHMLPTDRYMWSDASGKFKRTKEGTKLLSKHWQWVMDWVIDYHTPGGVDHEGWQYAIDFPALYHGRKGFTDYVRRRRWVRRAQLSTSGPWEELASTKLLHVSLQSEGTSSDEGPVLAWAVTIDGEAVFRKGVSISCPAGTSWVHVPCDQTLISISCGSEHRVWAIGRNGSALWRFGITSSSPTGEVWEVVEPPPGATLKLVSVGCWGVWVLDSKGQLSVRREVTSVFPEGTHWQTLPPLAMDNNDVVTVPEVEGCAVTSPSSIPPLTAGWRHVSAGPGGEVWAISSSGVVCRRHGVTKENPGGVSWSHGIVGGWQCITARGWTLNPSPC